MRKRSGRSGNGLREPLTPLPVQPLTKREATFGFYRDALAILQRAQIPFLVSGAFALEHYTGVRRNTKDLDIFLSKTDSRAALREFARCGYRAELKFSHWLGKVYHHNGRDFIDVIFNSGNGLCEVDADWFRHAVPGTIINTPVMFSAPEEMIWQKAFVMERERYDGADIAHLLRAQGQTLDWNRLLCRFHQHWRVLLSHLILFGYIYPAEQEKIPDWVYRNLLDRLASEMRAVPPAEPVCRGPFLSRSQYRIDIEAWGYRDPRLTSAMTLKEVGRWTAAASEEEPGR